MLKNGPNKRLHARRFALGSTSCYTVIRNAGPYPPEYPHVLQRQLAKDGKKPIKHGWNTQITTVRSPLMGDTKGKKEKNKAQKQKAVKDTNIAKIKKDKAPKSKGS